MRLEKIKLAGFKSFVDPTTVPITSNLVGIVGPNGCGKSNIIDAVRWVMGESSAKMLRGDSMADVIFNGSSTRNPVGQASVELLFDNADGGAGGQFSKFNQISVRRIVTRDGQSNYYLNGTRCRRRDITGLFLGTGLGPRSYSIIEQGMISRLIEARPEDLRMFLEEAAGISKYKERRKETENRIRHTRENLERLDDLREEMRKQIEHLRRQATVAEKYKGLKEQERRLKAELLALKRNLLEGQLLEQEKALIGMEKEREIQATQLRSLESRIEKDRQVYIESNDHFNQVQGKFYVVGGEISRIEQATQFARESRIALEEEQRRVDLERSEGDKNRRQDHQQLQESLAKLKQEEPQLQQVKTAEQAFDVRIADLDEQVRAAQTEWEVFNRDAAVPGHAAQLERRSINHLEQRLTERQVRRGRLQQEQDSLQADELETQVTRLMELAKDQQTRLIQLDSRKPKLLERIKTLREGAIQRSSVLNSKRSELQRLRGRLAALTAIQEEALGEKDQQATHWLQLHGMADAKRLVRSLEVEPAWQRAVEQVLGSLVQAIELDDLTTLGDGPEKLSSGSLSFVSTEAVHQGEETNNPCLLDKTTSQSRLSDLLAGILVADDLHQAWQIRSNLTQGQSVITRDGLWLGRNWLRVEKGKQQQSGILEREKEQLDLRVSMVSLESAEQQILDDNEQYATELRLVESQREQLQGEITSADRLNSATASELSGKQARLEQLASRKQQLAMELEELVQVDAKEQQSLEQARQSLHQALALMESFAQRREGLALGREKQRSLLQAEREQIKTVRDQVRSLEVRIGALSSTRDALAANLEREVGRLDQLKHRTEELHQKLAQSDAPLKQYAAELETQLALRVAVEKTLGEARTALQEVEQALRKWEAERNQTEQQVAGWNDKINQSRIDHQQVLVRGKTLEEQLKETGFDYPQLLESLEVAANPAELAEEWEKNLLDLDARIRRLGSINLAAIEEHKERAERSGYLEEQHKDISDALNTLEKAIHKIDKETRGRFKDTFDKVNTGLKQKFPQLFGGGHAYLELTGDDLLNTGVTVMARPPGKRNSSIHLLSGGEKALTAVALVFSIFELNPAPFCMLDEVDAPLDDANVGRFCELVKAMADRVQFIIISHNKITMEIAEQLMGVTMQEPGVSRLVSVDVSEAVKLAGAG